MWWCVTVKEASDTGTERRSRVATGTHADVSRKDPTDWVEASIVGGGGLAARFPLWSTRCFALIQMDSLKVSFLGVSRWRRAMCRHTRTHIICQFRFWVYALGFIRRLEFFFLQRSGPFNFTTRIYCPDSLNESIPDWNGFFMATVSHSTWLFTPHFSSVPASMLSLFDCLLLLFPLLLPWARSIRCAADRFSIQSGQV